MFSGLRRTRVRIAVAVALALTAGCGTTGHDDEVAAVIKGLDNPFFLSMADGIRSAADGRVTIQAAQSTSDTTGQADKLGAVAVQGYGCYIINPISGTNLVQSLSTIARDGRPVINIDSPVNPEAAELAGAEITSYVGTDNVAAGRVAGEHLAELAGDGARVAMVGGTAGDVTSAARLQGFEQATDGRLDIVQTVAVQDWSRSDALTRAEEILRANPGLAGFFVANDDMGLGVARAVANAGRTGEVAVVSVDGTEGGLAGVRRGDLAATVAQYPYTIGEMGMEACAAAIAGHDLPRTVDAPVALVTAGNVDAAEAAAPRPFEPYHDPFAELLGRTGGGS
ncbi:substrate-binding domain-containing protein [Marinactinospora rubrisoli]|uniref:Substrate-binding domain-containing protein n=1 Tax=Marinactinospora rubrisoli TaxID=2715399 RepID=A0ABW2KB44_9ACTN